MKFEGVGFTEAVEQLAAKVGIAVERDEDPAQRAADDAKARRRRALVGAHEIARAIFTAARQGAEAAGPPPK